MSKPRIYSTLIERCLEDGSLFEDGTYVYVTFDWECDENVSSITFRWKSESDTDWTIKTISASGKSGTVNAIFGDGSLSVELRYTFAISVATASSETILPGVIKSSRYIVDRKAEGRGLGVGRTAELEDVLDIEYKTRMLGGILQPMLPYGTDLNDVMTPNTYASGHVGPEKYSNCPASNGTFVLKVEKSGDEEEIMQTYIKCHKFAPKTYVRFYYADAWGEWMRIDASEVVLYENASGSATTVTLNQSVSEFDYIDIYFTDNNGRGCGYTRVMNPNGKLAHLGLQEAANTTVFLRQTVYTISGTTLTPNVTAASIVRISTENGAVPTMGTNYIRIVRVIGRA